MENIPYIEDLPSATWATKDDLVAEITSLRIEHSKMLDQLQGMQHCIDALTEQRDSAVATMERLGDWLEARNLCGLMPAEKALIAAIRSSEVTK